MKSFLKFLIQAYRPPCHRLPDFKELSLSREVVNPFIYSGVLIFHFLGAYRVGYFLLNLDIVVILRKSITNQGQSWTSVSIWKLAQISTLLNMYICTTVINIYLQCLKYFDITHVLNTKPTQNTNIHPSFGCWKFVQIQIRMIYRCMWYVPTTNRQSYRLFVGVSGWVHGTGWCSLPNNCRLIKIINHTWTTFNSNSIELVNSFTLSNCF